MEEQKTEQNNNSMAGKFQLYCGLVKNGEWYNYAELEKIKGGILTILDGADDSIPSRLLNIVKGCVKTLYSESGKELQLSSADYFNLTMIDAKQITREYAKYLTNNKHVFEENFRCSRCSGMSGESFTSIEENWNELIERGDVIEYFAKSKDDLFYETILPTGIEIEGNRNLQGGIFNKITRKNITVGDAIDVANDQFAMQSLSNKMCAIWDKEIVSIDEMDQQTFTAYVKRKNARFCKTYLINQEDIEAFYEVSNIGLDFSSRVVRCSKCNKDIADENGFIDETNFFSVFFQSNR